MIVNLSQLTNKEIEKPSFDVEQIKKSGKEAPNWIHFGGGNLYRGLHAELAQKLANQGILNRGIVVCETFDPYVIDEAYHPYNNDFIQVVMHENGQLDKQLIQVTAESYFANPKRAADWEQVQEYFKQPSLQMTTFTITEKGYGIKTVKGAFLPIIQQDIEQGPGNPQHTMSIVVSLLWTRFRNGAFPIAMISTDNFSQNGEKFQESVLTIAKAWKEKGFVSQEFIDYLSDEQKVSFPWSMVDRITPNPSPVVAKQLAEDGIEGMDIIHTPNHTNIAPFANTEGVHYLVIEDQFPNGRIDLDKSGIILTDRETVDKADTMKVTTCLNPLHTALAIFGCLLGYESIAKEMQDDDLVALIKQIGYQEGLPVVSDPGIIHAKAFIDEVIEKRLPNPYIPDTPQRIATDTSQKMAIRYGETIKKYLAAADRKPEQLTFIPLTIAAWLRYLLAIDDHGLSFELSPDPLLSELQEQLQTVYLGMIDHYKLHQAVEPILSNQTIFGVDLYEVGLGEKIEEDFRQMLQSEGAVRKVLQKKLRENEGSN